MTVAELIEALRTLPGDPDLLIVVVSVGESGDSQIASVRRNGVVAQLEPMSTLQFGHNRGPGW